MTADCGTFKRLPEDSRPSHVVTAISYGGNAHIVFSKVVNHGFSEELFETLIGSFQNIHVDYDKMDIEGYLEAKVELPKVKIPIDIHGSFEIDYFDRKESSRNITSIKVSLVFSQ